MQVQVDGSRECDAGLVFGRGAVSWSRRRRLRMGRSWRTRGRTSSTSAASRRGPGPRRSSVEEEVARTEPVVADLAGARPHGLDRHLEAGRRRGGARRRRRDRQRRHRAARRPRARRPLRRSRGRPSSSCTCRGPRGRCRTNPTYEDVVDDVRAFLAERVEAAVAAGVDEERIWVDPGIGFGKTLEHNLELLRRLGELRDLGRPILVGTSRKSFIGKVDGSGADRRIGGTIASSVLAVAAGADVLRVHDVAEAAQATRVAAAILG